MSEKKIFLSKIEKWGIAVMLFGFFYLGMVIIASYLQSSMFNILKYIYNLDDSLYTMAIASIIFITAGNIISRFHNWKNNKSIILPTIFEGILIVMSVYMLFNGKIVISENEIKALIVASFILGTIIETFVGMLRISKILLIIFKSKIKDPKDRITIMIGVAGVVISVVTLFR